MNVYYVYVYFRPNGIPCYVGKGKDKRWLRHFVYTANRHLRNLIAKHGDLPVIKIRENLSAKEASEIEIALIKVIGRTVNGGPLVNMTDGGDGAPGWKHSKAFIARLKKRRVSQKTRHLISKGNKAYFSQPEQRKKNSQRMIGNRNSVGNRSNLGRKFSLSHRKKMADARREYWRKYRLRTL